MINTDKQLNDFFNLIRETELSGFYDDYEIQLFWLMWIDTREQIIEDRFKKRR